MTEYKVSSLFAGVGGICLGFKNAKKIKSNKEINVKLGLWNIDKY